MKKRLLSILLCAALMILSTLTILPITAFASGAADVPCKNLYRYVYTDYTTGDPYYSLQFSDANYNSYYFGFKDAAGPMVGQTYTIDDMIAEMTSVSINWESDQITTVSLQRSYEGLQEKFSAAITTQSGKAYNLTWAAENVPASVEDVDLDTTFQCGFSEYDSFKVFTPLVNDNSNYNFTIAITGDLPTVGQEKTYLWKNNTVYIGNANFVIPNDWSTRPFDAKYVIKGVEGGYEGTAEYSMTNGKKYEFAFTYTAPATYAITNGTAQDANGSITVAETATEGETVTITVNPATGYQLKSLKYNDGSDHDITKDPISGNYQFTMPAANITVTATFEVAAEEISVIVEDARLIKKTLFFQVDGDDTQNKYGITVRVNSKKFEGEFTLENCEPYNTGVTDLAAKKWFDTDSCNIKTQILGSNTLLMEGTLYTHNADLGRAINAHFKLTARIDENGELMDAYGNIVEPAEGETKEYNRLATNTCFYSDSDFKTKLKYQSGTVTMVECADGTVYWKDPISAYTRGTWIKGKKEGSTITFATKQPVFYNTSYNASLSVRWGNFNTERWTVADDYAESFIFDIKGDSLIMRGTQATTSDTATHFPGIFWDDDDSFYGYGDCGVTLTAPMSDSNTDYEEELGKDNTTASIKDGVITIEIDDGENRVVLKLYADPSAEKIPAGTYAFSDTGDEGTALISTGIKDGVPEASFVATLEEGEITDCWILTEGSVTLAYNGSVLEIEIDAKNSNGKTVSVTAEFEEVPAHTHAGVKQNGQPATETAAGFKDYYKCSCGLYFEEEACTTLIGDDTALAEWKAEGGNGYRQILPHSHNFVKQNEVKATADTAGCKEYYLCSCGEAYEDEALTQKITNLGAWKAEGGMGYIAPNGGNDPSPIDDPEPDDKGGANLTWLWILLGILGLLIVLYVVLFFVWKKKEELPNALAFLGFLVPSYKAINNALFKKKEDKE